MIGLCVQGVIQADPNMRVMWTVRQCNRRLGSGEFRPEKTISWVLRWIVLYIGVVVKYFVRVQALARR